jgi:oligoribonuclease
MALAMESAKPKKSKTPLVWIDMEMTGLDPNKERIIEIATLITDTDLRMIAEGPNIVIHQGPKILHSMDSWNKKHHHSSGLLDAVKKSKISLKRAEKMTLDFIKKHCEPKKSPLCGNSIHHDRRFLERYMPSIHEYLHYRHIDVSSVKALAQYWYPKDKEQYKKNNTHRALDDIRESIEELTYLRKKIFKTRLKSSK